MQKIQRNKKKLLELINKFSKIAGYEIILQKVFVFLYISEQPKNEIKKKSSFTIVSKKIKYLGINLRKMQNLCSEYYKTLLKETRDLNVWKNIPCFWLRRLVDMAAHCVFFPCTIKQLTQFSADTDQMPHKFNSVLTMSIWRQQWILPSVQGLSRTGLPPVQIPVRSAGYYLCF